MGKKTALLLAFVCAVGHGAPAHACGCDPKAKKTAFAERAKQSAAKIAANMEKLKKRVELKMKGN